MAFNYDPNSANTTVAAVDDSKKLRIGIIGTGWIADAHIASYKKMKDVFSLTTVAYIEKLYGIDIFTVAEEKKENIQFSLFHFIST